MNFKRVLTMLLAVCLVLNMAAPGALAVMPGADTMTKAPAPEAVENVPTAKPVEITTLRDANRPVVNTQTGKSGWSIEQLDIEPGVELLHKELPKGVQELREAADLYQADETVAAYIILKDAPLAEGGYTTMAQVPEKDEAAMLRVQDKLIQTINKKVLGGKKLDVRYQFTYLTNAISANVPFGKLEEIAKLDGVKNVILMPIYEPATVDTKTVSAGGMIGVPSVWEDLGYTGEGMKIAVVDTGLDLDHPSFAAAPPLTGDSLTVEDIEMVLPKLNASALYTQVTAEELYYSEKVPYAFNYVDENLQATHDRDGAGDHGTHVSGIAAANALEGSGVVGVAPDAQIIVMKVFGANGGAYHDDMVASIEDALLLNVDVINMSLGGSCGFTSEDPELDEIYNRVNYHDVILSVSAGNEGTSAAGNMWGTDLNRTDHPDTSTVGSPSTYGGSLSIASAENVGVIGPYLTVDGENHGYSDALGLYVDFRSLAGQELEYVMIPGLGNTADFEGLDVTGKVAVISRGEINFSLKLYNAEQAGAAGCIIYNNQPGAIGLQMTDDNGNLNDGISGEVPCVSVTQEVGQALADAAEKKLTVSAEDGLVPSAEGGQMSLFSSWGVTPDLKLKPEITAVGGNMYSCYTDGQYGLMSGTSMSAPQLAGAAALVLQYLAAEFPDLTDTEERDVAQALLMSTAIPIISNTSNVEASPRQQGAGLVNAAAALKAEAYLSVKGQKLPKAELGDDPAKTGAYTFTFRIHNMADHEQTYTLSGSVLTEDVLDYGDGLEFMANYDRELDGKVTFSRSTVTVPAGGIVPVEATVKLTAGDKAWLDEHYANGIYIEGFVYATNGNGEDLSLPYMGFYGDWTTPPIMDTAFWTDESFASDSYEGLPEGNEYYHVVWTKLGNTEYVLGYNPYTGLLENYDPLKHNVLSPNGDGVLDSLSDIYVSLMRNARTLEFTFTDAKTGEVYDVTKDVYARKTCYMSNYGQVVPYVYSWTFADVYDMTDAAGKTLANNTRVNMTVSATTDYVEHTEDLTGDSWSVPITVDTQAPAIVAANSISTASGNFLELTIEENMSLAQVFVMNSTNTRILSQTGESTDNGDGTFTVTLDVTNYGNEFLVIGGDYAANEGAYMVTFEGEDDNLPMLDSNTVYAYRVADDAYTDDSLYGWVTINPETAEVTTLTTDVLEYYALTAAEYAGGYIFAVDAGYNLLAMKPGVWTRTEICNLGVNIADMSFDATTNTMYMVGKLDYTNKLLALDLLTGEYEVTADLGSGTVYSIEFTDDGELYAIKGSSSKLWKMNWETGNLEAVLEFADGEYPYYSQSMTYDAENNCMYWAYCTYTNSGFAIYTIDLDTMTYTKANLPSNSEYVGMLMLDDGVQVPDCDGENCPSKAFIDLNNRAWYHEAVDYVLNKGLMNGMGDGIFGPNKNSDRAAVVTVLYRMAGSPAVEGTLPFTDVSANAYYADALRWAVQNGICNGRTPTTFCPFEFTTRQEMVVFLYRFAKYMGYDVTARYDSLASFVDANQVYSYARNAMRWAVGEGIVAGMDPTHLGPKATSTRAQMATLLMRTDKLVNAFHVPAGELSGLTLAPERFLMAVGGSNVLSVKPFPWNAKLSELSFSSTDESVAVVSADGVVTGVGGGECDIVVVCGELSAYVPVRIVDVQGTVHAYSYYSATMGYGNWLTMDLSDLSSVELGALSPVDFIAAEYHGQDQKIYGFDGNYTLYSWNPETDELVTIGSAGSNVQITDMAYDYSSDAMYAVGVDLATYQGCLYQVDLRTAKLHLIGPSLDGLAFFGLAIDLEGNMYTLDSESNFYRSYIYTMEDMWTGQTMTGLVSEQIAATGFGGLNYTQSICYDHDNDQIIWAACGGYSSIFWIDPNSGDVLDLGAPAGDTFFEFIGMHTVPDVIPERPFIAIEEAELADTLVVMEGGVKAAPLSLKPLNASIESMEWTSSDESVATVDASGNVTGIHKGEATISVTVQSGGNNFTDSMTVQVMASADNMYAFLMTDIASMAGDVFMGLNDTDPEHPEYIAGVGMTFNGMEYYDGMLYGYGYDPNSWEVGNNLFVTIDPTDFSIVNVSDSGSDHFIYDMAYDYSSATMYTLAGFGETAPDLYMVNLDNGRLIQVADLEGSFKSLAIDAEGNAYVTSSADAYEDPDTWEYVTPNSMLYRLDLTTGETTFVGDTGMKNNMFSAMAFDYDTGNLYWNTCYRMDFFSPVESKFCVVDPQTGLATALGTIGTNGSQITGLYCVADEYPAEPETTLTNVNISEPQKLLTVGESAVLEAWAVHPSCGAVLTWTYSDESVAVVDETGLVTAVAAGNAIVTVTATLDDVAVSDECKVCVFEEGASFLAFSDSEMAWGTVGRMDPSAVTTGIAAEAVSSAAYVGDAIYGYDGNNKLFVIEDESTMERTVLGGTGLDIDQPGGIVSAGMTLVFEIRGMSYDAVTERMLVLGVQYEVTEYGNNEIIGGAAIYEADLLTGALTKLCTLSDNHSQYRSLTVDDKGTVYVFNCFDDYFSTVDVATGEVVDLVGTYTMSLYGDTDSVLPMAYDATTGLIYMLFTSNGNFYRLLTMNPETSELTLLGDVGELVYDEDDWTYRGPTYTALLIK